MNIVLFGAGAVGLGIGSCVAAADDVRLSFVARPDTRRELARHGLRRSGIFGQRHVPAERFAAVERIDELGDVPVDFVLVCTKSFDSPVVAEALASARCCRSDSCRVVLFQNGWGNFEVFARRIEPRRVYSARVITGFRLVSPAHVEVTVHADAIKLGSLAGAELTPLEPLARVITEGGIPAEVTPTIERDLWAKMLYNCCLNPLGAILDVEYGRLGESPATRALMDEIAREVFAVLRAAGHTTHWDDAAGFLRDFYGQMLPATYAHRSSMLQDLQAGRRTEIDAISGAVVELAAQLGLDVPYDRAMREMVRFEETKQLGPRTP